MARWKAEVELKAREFEMLRRQLAPPKDLDQLRAKIQEELEGPHQQRLQALATEAEKYREMFFNVRICCPYGVSRCKVTPASCAALPSDCTALLYNTYVLLACTPTHWHRAVRAHAHGLPTTASRLRVSGLRVCLLWCILSAYARVRVAVGVRVGAGVGACSGTGAPRLRAAQGRV
jgi:hypothetical protein